MARFLLQEMEDDINETSFMDDMSSIVTCVTADYDKSKKKGCSSSVLSSMKNMISLVNDAQSVATMAYA